MWKDIRRQDTDCCKVQRHHSWPSQCPLPWKKLKISVCSFVELISWKTTLTFNSMMWNYHSINGIPWKYLHTTCLFHIKTFIFRLALYVFYSYLYNDEQKSYPKIDLIIAIVLAFTWLVASSAWANGLNGLKSLAEVQTWIFDDENGPCSKKKDGNFIYTNIENCQSAGDTGEFCF